MTQYYKFLSLLIFVLGTVAAQAQLLTDKNSFTRQDTLRGSITPEREWWDLTYYHLDIKVDPDNKFISGKNTVQYKVLKKDSVLQIDLQAPLNLTKAIQNGKELVINHDGNAHFIHLEESQSINEINNIEV